MQTVNGVDRIAVDGNRDQLAINHRTHPVLIRVPLREPGKISENSLRVGMENMWSVLVDENSRIIIAVISVSTDVIALVYQKNRITPLRRETLRQHTAGEARPNNQPVKHPVLLASLILSS